MDGTLDRLLQLAGPRTTAVAGIGGDGRERGDGYG